VEEEQGLRGEGGGRRKMRGGERGGRGEKEGGREGGKEGGGP